MQSPALPVQRIVLKMIKVRYEEMKFHYTTNHYDYHLSGTCIHNGKVALYESSDETDYETMTNTCPCCKENGTDNGHDCHCQNAPDVFCYITELPFHKRVYYRMRKYFQILWFIRHWGINGYYYWRRWTR